MKFTVIFPAVALSFMLWQCSRPTDTSGGSSEHSNALVSGYLFNADHTPANGAEVVFIPVSFNPNGSGKAMASTDTVITDEDGYYGTNDLTPGTYNVFGSGNGNLSLIDSAVFNGDTTHLPYDTLKLPGTLNGFVKLHDGDSPRNALVILFGTGTVLLPAQNGAFSLANLAEGDYSVRFLTNMGTKYDPLDTSFTIRAGATDNLIDSVEIPLKIPIPTGFMLAYDTLKQIVTLTWNKMDTAKVSGYHVFRQHAGNADSLLTPLAISDTFFFDSSALQDETYIYRVASVNSAGAEGLKGIGDTITIVCAFSFKKIFGKRGSGQGEYQGPYAVALARNRTVMVVDFDSSKVIHYDTSGLFIKEDTGFTTPINIVSSSNGNYYLVEKDTRLIKIVDSLGVERARFGGPGTGPGKFSSSLAFLVISITGDLYIPDYSLNHIQILDSTGQYKKELAIGQPWSITFLNSTTLAVGSDLLVTLLDTNGTKQTEWQGVYAFISALTANSNLAIATFVKEGPVDVSKIAIYSPQGDFLAIFGTSNRSSPFFLGQIKGMAIDTNNNLYIADYNSEVKVFILNSRL